MSSTAARLHVHKTKCMVQYFLVTFTQNKYMFHLCKSSIKLLHTTQCDKILFFLCLTSLIHKKIVPNQYCITTLFYALLWISLYFFNVHACKVKCSYGVSVSNPMARKSFTFTITRMWNLFWPLDLKLVRHNCTWL